MEEGLKRGVIGDADADSIKMVIIIMAKRRVFGED